MTKFDLKIDRSHKIALRNWTQLGWPPPVCLKVHVLPNPNFVVMR
jgi:hypothetical protein